MPAAPFTVPTANVTHGALAGAFESLIDLLDAVYDLDPAEASAATQTHIGAYADTLSDAGADPDVTTAAVELCQNAADMICLARADGEPATHPYVYAARSLLLRARGIVGRDIASA